MRKTALLFCNCGGGRSCSICCAGLIVFCRKSFRSGASNDRVGCCGHGRRSTKRLRRATRIFARRFSNAVNAYVLPPWAFFFGELFEGQGFRHGPPDYLFTQEIEMGLPFRFNVAAEAQFERFNGGGGARSVSLEARWALADWNKIPLNPTLFAEYKFGVGTVRHEEVAPPMGEGGEEEEEEEGGPPKVPDAYEFRLLLAQDFGEHVEWAMNWFFEKENTGDRGREWGFSQAAMTPILLPNERLKVGIEMQYKNTTVKDTRGDPLHSFTIGPTVAWKPTAQTRLDISPLFGCTAGAPVADVFVAFSWLFGGERAEAEAPVSSRFRYYTDAAYARSGKDSGKEMKQVAYVPPCPQWYGDREWNLNLFGTYAFTNTEFAPNPSLVDIVQSTSEGGPVLGTYDRYIGGDHAWGGGGDIKYFFCRYAGVGVEGFVLDGSKPGFDIFEDQSVPIFVHTKNQSQSYHRHCAWHTYVAVSNSVHAFRALCMGGCWRDFRRRRKGSTSHARAAGRLRCQCADRTFRRRNEITRSIWRRSRISVRAKLRLD